MWTSIANLPNYHMDLKGRVMVDIFNEPDSMGMRWKSVVSASDTAAKPDVQRALFVAPANCCGWHGDCSLL